MLATGRSGDGTAGLISRAVPPTGFLTVVATALGIQHGPALNQPPSPWFLEPVWFPVFFLLLWAGITGLLAILSGWASLAGYFRADGQLEGERFRFVSGSMGARLFPVNYRGSLFLTVNQAGFRLAIFFPFRLLSPPLFIPWKAVASVESKRLLFFRYVVVRLRDQWPTISIRGAAGREVEVAYGRASDSHAQ
jgi:hypothetical protein